MAFSRFLCPCVHRDVRLFDEHGAVGRAHDAVAGGKLFKAVRAQPAMRAVANSGVYRSSGISSIL